MKYDVSIREIQGAKRLILSLISIQPRSFGRFEAIIDTGSPRTIISASDSLKLAIPFSIYSESECLRGVGKGNIPTVEINKFKLVLKSLEGSSKNIEMKVITPNVPRLRKEAQKEFENALNLPSIIGLDFLENNRLKLLVNLPESIAYLEDV